MKVLIIYICCAALLTIIVLGDLRNSNSTEILPFLGLADAWAQEEGPESSEEDPESSEGDIELIGEDSGSYDGDTESSELGTGRMDIDENGRMTYSGEQEEVTCIRKEEDPETDNGEQPAAKNEFFVCTMGFRYSCEDQCYNFCTDSSEFSDDSNPNGQYPSDQCEGPDKRREIDYIVNTTYPSLDISLEKKGCKPGNTIEMENGISQEGASLVSCPVTPEDENVIWKVLKELTVELIKEKGLPRGIQNIIFDIPVERPLYEYMPLLFVRNKAHRIRIGKNLEDEEEAPEATDVYYDTGNQTDAFIFHNVEVKVLFDVNVTKVTGY